MIDCVEVAVFLRNKRTEVSLRARRRPRLSRAEHSWPHAAECTWPHFCEGDSPSLLALCGFVVMTLKAS